MFMTPLVPQQAKQPQDFALHSMGRRAVGTPPASQGRYLRVSTTELGA